MPRPLPRPLPHRTASKLAALTLLPALLGVPACGRPPRPVVMAPALQSTGHHGEPVDLAALRGQVVVVDFWASWCAPCRRSFPALEALYQRLHDRGLAVIAVSLDENPVNYERFVRGAQPSFTVVHDQRREFVAPWSVRTMPTTLVIDRRGAIHTRIENPSADAEQLLEQAVLAALEGS